MPILSFGSESLNLTTNSFNKLSDRTRNGKTIPDITLRERFPNMPKDSSDLRSKNDNLGWRPLGWKVKIKRIIVDTLRNTRRSITLWTDDINRVKSNWIYDPQFWNKWKLLRNIWIVNLLTTICTWKFTIIANRHKN